MAGGSLYEDDEGPGAITDINVTPFVDVVLVLLIIFMVTAKLIVARGIEIEKAKAATGGEVLATLKIIVDKDGKLYINGALFEDDAGAIARIKEITGPMKEPKAIVSGDARSAYAGVMRAIDLIKRSGNIGISLENVAPPR
jgi:biopolymer transport protein ExbD